MTWVMDKAGRIIDNANTTTLVNNTTKEVTITVPAGKRWTFMLGGVENVDNVPRVTQVYVLTSSDVLIGQLFYANLGATERGYFPSMIVANNEHRQCRPSLLILKAGQKINFRWSAGGASAGGTTEYCFEVLEQDV